MAPLESLRTPAGRKLDFRMLMEFCYNLTETDVMILEWMLKQGKGKEYSVDDIRDVFNLSRATVNRVLSKLADMELIDKKKKRRNETGRPRYVYSIDSDKMYEKLVRDISNCSSEVEQYVKNMLGK
ncbi:MAG: hypothetical protein F7B60_07415 [Desulfurococcales archaeon]|nr:hypothetical protein [Desulfurococcales archaeon]